MGIIERIKSALGLDTSASSPSSPSSTPDRKTGEQDDDAGPTSVSEVERDEQVEGARTVVDPDDEESDDVDVTVEHEPDTRSEDAVKGTDTAGTGSSADVGPADADGASAEAETAAGADLEEIKGIGPAYADRLREAGVEDVAALAAADAGDLADRTDLGEGRVQKWIDRAGAR